MKFRAPFFVPSRSGHDSNGVDQLESADADAAHRARGTHGAADLGPGRHPAGRHPRPRPDGPARIGSSAAAAAAATPLRCGRGGTWRDHARVCGPLHAGRTGAGGGPAVALRE